MRKNEEPSAEFLMKEIGDPKKYSEIVFCGYGEPTIRWEELKKIAKYVKDKGGKTRLNTNGHGNDINKKDITPGMKGLLDSVSISLNATDEDNFAKKSKQYVPEVVLTIVDEQEIDVEMARKIAEDEVGVSFRVREYF